MRMPLRFASLLCAGCLAALAQFPPRLDTGGVPGEPHSLVIVIEPMRRAGIAEAGDSETIHIVVRNVSDHTVVTDESTAPTLFAARILDELGHSVALTPLGDRFYHPPPNSVFVVTSMAIRALAPREEIQCDWKLSELFDLSKPGKYRVMLMRDFAIGDPAPGATKPLVETVSSNTIELRVP